MIVFVLVRNIQILDRNYVETKGMKCTKLSSKSKS